MERTTACEQANLTGTWIQRDRVKSLCQGGGSPARHCTTYPAFELRRPRIEVHLLLTASFGRLGCYPKTSPP